MFRSRIAIVLFVTLMLCSAAFSQSISSFETEQDSPLLSPSGATVTRVQEHASDGDWALKVFFPGSPKDSWPGIVFTPDVDTTKHEVLAFDAYNPADENFALSWRIDFVDGETQFGSDGIPPHTVHRTDVWVGSLPRISRITLYLRMPRSDRTLFVDNFRWTTVEQRFHALHYVDDAASSVASQEDTQRGFTVFQRPITDVVFANSIPRTEELRDTIQLFGTPGEYEPAAFSLYAIEDLSNVNISVDGLPADVEILPVRSLNKRVVYSSNEYISEMPVLCEKRSTFDVAAHTAKRIVLDLHINADTAPGIHSGTVQIDIAGKPRTSLPITLNVLPYTLTEPTDMFWGEYYLIPRTAKTDEERAAALRSEMTDMRQHGMTSVGLCFGLDGDAVTWAPDGTCTISPAEDSLYSRFMDLYVELGYPMPVVLLSDSGQGAASAGGDEPFGSTAWGERYKTFWRTMQQLHAQRGWPEVIVQPVDEPGWQSREHKNRNITCLKLLKQIPGMRTEQDGPGDAYFHNEAGPYADMWNYNGGVSDAAVISNARAANKIITLYNCDVESYRPEVDRYATGWFQEAAGGINGCYNWAYMSWRVNPYDDLSHKTTGTWMHVYPPMGEEPGGPSTGWIGAREGIDDYKYIYTLRQTIERAQQLGTPQVRNAAKNAQSTLAELVSSLTYSPVVRGTAQWTEAGRDVDGQATIGGTLKVPNGWEHVNYETARWQIAQATMDVMSALGEISPQSATTIPDATSDDALIASAVWANREQLATQTPAGGARQTTIPIWTSSPVLDGELNDKEWSDAAILSPFVPNAGTRAPQMQTDVRLGSDGKNLWLGITCHEDKMAYITADITRDGGNIWEDDCVELFIDHNLDRRTFRQVLVNSLGKQGWNDPTDLLWKATSLTKTTLHEDEWVIEWCIPMADLGLTGSPFGLNVCRERRPMETMELTCWAPTGGSFGQPSTFGTANFGQTWISALNVPPAALGTNNFGVTLTNGSATTRRIATQLSIDGAASGDTQTVRPAGGRVDEIELAAGASTTRNYAYEVMTSSAPELMLRITDASSGQELATRTFTPEVASPMELTVRPQITYLANTQAIAEIELNLAEDLRAQSRLVLVLYDAQGSRVRQQVVDSLRGDRLSARINIASLAAGKYTLRASLERITPLGIRRITLQHAQFRRVQGPFD